VDRFGDVRRWRRFCILLVLLPVLLATTPPIAARAEMTLLITTQDDTTNNCSSTGNAPCSLRDAIGYANAHATASNHVTISIPRGIYVLTQVGASNFVITANGVFLRGAGASTTIIDGASRNGGGPGTFPRIFDIADGAAATIEGVTIRNGGGTSNTQGGGGIYNRGTLTLAEVVLTQNGTPSIGGGGIYNSGRLSITDSTLSSNSGPSGGGIYNANPGSVILTSSTVSGNEAYFGGGIYNASALGRPDVSGAPPAITISKSLISGNTASTEILFIISLRNTLGGLGAGLYTADGLVKVDASTFQANLASGIGTNTAVTGRQASLGGAMYSGAPPDSATGNGPDTGRGNGAATITNSTLSGNVASQGGGYYQHSSGSAHILETTIAANTTGIAAAAVAAGDTQPIVLSHSIIAYSQAGANCVSALPGNIIDAGFNLEDGMTCALSAPGSHSNLDPQLDPLTNNGGPTPTHALRLNSPAIDAAGTTCSPVDQRGIARPQPGNGNCDIGAYERVPPMPKGVLSPTLLNFNSQEVGTASVAKQFVVVNSGDAILNIETIALGGSDQSDFVIVENTCGKSIAAGTACVVSVTFTPTSEGNKNATVTITDNSENTPRNQQVVTLSGNGTIAVSYRVTLSIVGEGLVSPALNSASYQAGKVVTYSASAGTNTIFIGWTIDGNFAGFAPQLALPVSKDRVLVAVFAPVKTFTDVSSNDPNFEAITELSSRGIIRGNGDGTFKPDAPVLRAQSAGLLARTFGWDREEYGNPFPDQCEPLRQNCIDSELWNDVGALAFYGVARGYPDQTYQPRSPVLSVQVISFITRAFVTQNYWIQATVEDAAIYPNVPRDSGHRLDLITYVRQAGALQGQPANGTLHNYDQPASRGFYAAVLWQAYRAYFGVNRIP
jgi:CSLREA domain-containing protein